MTGRALHYFDLPGGAPASDIDLGAAKIMGHVPTTCLLPGNLVWSWIARDSDPCEGCYGPRARCGGRDLVEPGSLAGTAGDDARALRWITGGRDPVGELLKRR